ncbi:dicarboxylate/amino acid:cation symporter [Sphingomonas rosea]|uniref:Dicarboxylate/amino acid:cation symporter n=1 Tax=Sphingomonas rosea TaxID=335605 RepID=A0ABP7UGR6_9SPHN
MATQTQSSSSLRRSTYGQQILVAIAVGLALGLFARSVPGAAWLTGLLETVGSIFVQLLKLLVPPLIVGSVVSSIAGLGTLTNGARLAGKTLLWFAITATLAVAVGLVAGTILTAVQAPFAVAAAKAPANVGGWLDFLKGVVPVNLLGLEARTTIDGETVRTALNFNVLQLLVLSLLLGVAAVRTGEKGQPFLAFAASLLAISRLLLGWLLKLVPVGTAALLGTAVATYGWATLAALGGFTIALYAALAAVAFGVYPALLLAKGLSVGEFARAAWPAAQLGFITRSSIGTLPVTEERTVDVLGVPRAYAAFAVPLGATTKMDGCAAVYPAVAALFIAHAYGIALGPEHYVLIALVSVLGSAATAGVTGATVMLTLTLSTLGLPLEGVGLLLAIDPIIDMGRTALNVTGQMLVPYIVSKDEGLLAEPSGAPLRLQPA